MIGATEIIVIIGAGVFLFGGKKVVDWARSVGQAKKVFETESKHEGDINVEKA